MSEPYYVSEKKMARAKSVVDGREVCGYLDKGNFCGVGLLDVIVVEHSEYNLSLVVVDPKTIVLL